MQHLKSGQAAVLDFMASPDAYGSVHGKVERIRARLHRVPGGRPRL